MTTLNGLRINSYSPEELLGPLNDVEKKYAPKKLYAVGDMPVPLPGPRSAIIGSREASPEGLRAAKDIAKTLVRNGVVVVSGLAKGIDTSAHKTAIEEGGQTITMNTVQVDVSNPCTGGGDGIDSEPGASTTGIKCGLVDGSPFDFSAAAAGITLLVALLVILGRRSPVRSISKRKRS